MHRRPLSLWTVLVTAALVGAGATGCAKRPEPGTLVLLNGDIYTGEAGFSDARAMVITGRTITAVCKTNDWAKRYVGKETRVIDLDGKFVMPGLIDAHLDFAAAGSLLYEARLAPVGDDNAFRTEIRRLTGLLPDGEWINGGGWGTAATSSPGSADDSLKSAPASWRPDRALIDELTPRHPCLLSRFDEKIWLANEAALKAAGLDRKRLPGLEIGSDGKPTGIVVKPSPAFVALQKARRPKSLDRLLAENRAVLKLLRESGIVEIHDVSSSDQVERFIALEAASELTCRVWLRPDLSLGPELKAAGLTMGLHPKTRQKSYWLRYGALMGYVDGGLAMHEALLFEPYSDRPGEAGRWRPHSSNDPDLKTGDMEKLYGLIQAGLEAGFVPNIQAVGDRAVAETLGLFERILKERQQPLKGFRIIGAQMVRPEDIKRFRKLGVIAEVDPAPPSVVASWLEDRIGKDRARTSYPFKSLLDGGALLIFGSDGAGTGVRRALIRPQDLIYDAIARRAPDDKATGGWLPGERITVKEAIKAYTINAAIAAFEDDLRGSLEANKFADLTIFDRNLLKIKPEEILKAEVTHTIVDGRIVFEKK
jgi:predicted amidohydrolase YtcJ